MPTHSSLACRLVGDQPPLYKRLTCVRAKNVILKIVVAGARRHCLRVVRSGRYHGSVGKAMAKNPRIAIALNAHEALHRRIIQELSGQVHRYNKTWRLQFFWTPWTGEGTADSVSDAVITAPSLLRQADVSRAPGRPTVYVGGGARAIWPGIRSARMWPPTRRRWGCWGRTIWRASDHGTWPIAVARGRGRSPLRP